MLPCREERLSAQSQNRGAEITRRAALLGGVSLLFARNAAAAFKIGTFVRSIEEDEIGTTVTMMLANAPYPYGGAPYKDNTVIAFIPSHFRYVRGEGASILVHFHGHNTTARDSLDGQSLREQMAESKQNAILIAPQGPVEAADSSAGKLETERGLARLLEESLRVLALSDLRETLGTSMIPEDAEIGTVCLSAHSGGYRAAASCLDKGGVTITEVFLFDALYAEAETFRKWVLAGKGRRQRERHKLVSYFTGGQTEAATRALAHSLETEGVRCEVENVEGILSRAQITHAEFVGIKTSLAHDDVAAEFNSLRDCLIASAMPRHVRTAWFDEKDGARPLDRRR